MTDTPSSPSGSEDASQHVAARREKLRKIAALGVDPWGSRFDDHQAIGAIRHRTGEIFYQTEAGEQIVLPDPGVDFRAWLAEQPKGELHGPRVRAAGRIVLRRTAGKLLFIDIRDWTGQVQILIGMSQIGAEGWELAQQLDLGDLVGVDGVLRRTKTGELTIFAEQLHFLTKTIEPPPDKHHGLSDVELRHRMRYLDLLYTEGAQDRFLKRTKIVQSIRRTLNERGFVEVEGPTLHTIAGGAAARPFLTHHNALDMQLYLRIALELHLKRLLVGGIERVYELGRVYRNEGISPRHNPEFTMLEVYQAYGNYETMMELTEKLILDAIHSIGDHYLVNWNGREVDFTPPFERASYDELFARHVGVDPNDHEAVARVAREIGFDTVGRDPDVIKSDVFEEKVEDKLEGPVFVIDYPASICPLTKRSRNNPQLAERFELFVCGMEVANAYTELNDPDLQEQLFRTQLAGQKDEDSMAKMDHDFIRALRHGMPPAGGLGIGIDRLVMLLTGTASIRDVILFPLLREEKEAPAPKAP